MCHVHLIIATNVAQTHNLLKTFVRYFVNFIFIVLTFNLIVGFCVNLVGNNFVSEEEDRREIWGPGLR